MSHEKLFAFLALAHVPFLWVNLNPTNVDEAMWSILLMVTFIACIVMAIAGRDFHPE